MIERGSETRRRYSRREVLALAGGALAVACARGVEPDVLAGDGGAGAADGPPATPRSGAVTSVPAAPPTPEPTPTPRPVPPAGQEERLLLPGTDWETPAVLAHTGIEGPRVVVLGGVHGNEPGGWLAAEEIAGWSLSRGSLVVVPRANRLATFAFERTLPDLGDLNRLYPGSEDGEPMARMAREIVALAREVHADWLLDLHESWGFYRERGDGSGTAFIGQTVTVGMGAEPPDFVQQLVDEVNESLPDREQLVFRDRRFRSSRPPGTGGGGFGSSSLSVGRHVPGLTPVLIEMGQDRQPESRRAELHRIFVRAVLERVGAA